MLMLWHSPRCRKSRETLTLIEAAGAKVSVRLYLEDVPSVAELKDILAQLGFDDPRSLMRRGEAVYKEQGLKSVSSNAALVKAMAEHAILIERPVVSNGEQAVIGRPPEAVKILL